MATLSSPAGEDGSQTSSTSASAVGRSAPGALTTSPRASSPTSRPCRFTAQRTPGSTRSRASPCVCSPRTRARRPPGWTSTSSPVARAPPVRVPVTTAPKPRIVKTRSIGSRGGPARGVRGAAPPASSRSRSRSASSPLPVWAETGTTGTSASGVPASRSRTSSAASSAISSSTRSVFVSATSPRSIPSSWQMATCSRVCGMTPSSAATTSISRSMPVAPATMVRTSFSCPGTSTTERRSPSPSSSSAKPRSIVMPRSFSSGSRSGSTPVSARTRADLPWSMWPAVPRTSPFAALSRPVALLGMTNPGARRQLRGSSTSRPT